MFNVKALWWTILTVWILGSTYWHVCKIQQLCDVLYDSPLFLTEVVPVAENVDISENLRLISNYPIDIAEAWQHAIMVSITLLLGFFTGNSYESRKTRELRYKLNRINRELIYYQSKR
ncbi:hypothetical protein [Dyadobacter arcticus]|uniref:Uncharacterized protein n=1 Tax=Dyadobacter arcticus TaxID=1078754 RepID=A0ABX0UKE5_9BACT|nr:hypothetical protein [Dyadobacter arcticus]NIJ52150.1 hypothetical protein [Dyadobacter arcticus]